MHIKNKFQNIKKKAQGSVETAIKVLTAVVLGAAILMGLYGLVTGVVLPSTETAVSSMFAYSAEANGGNGGTAEPIPGTEPTILDGANQTLLMAARPDLRVRSSAPLNEFNEVKVNGETIDPSNYILTEGSTIVTLKESYISTLNGGTHEISVVSDSGTASTNFTLDDSGIIPEGVTYYQASSIENCTWCMTTNNLSCTTGQCSCGYTYSKATPDAYAGETFPTLQMGDVYVCGDYMYEYLGVNTSYGWRVTCLNNRQTSYGEILAVINGKPVESLALTFAYNTNLEVAPLAPSTVTNMCCTFDGCTALRSYVGSKDADGDFSNYVMPASNAATFRDCPLITVLPQ